MKRNEQIAITCGLVTINAMMASQVLSFIFCLIRLIMPIGKFK
jgi:hypothetical protein